MSHPKILKTCGLQMHAYFLSCCKLWYGTNRICYDFVLRETWHPEFYFQNAKKNEKFLNDSISYQGHMTHIQIQKNLCHMLLVFTLSFVILLWPLLRFLSCTHDQDSRTPINKMLTLTLRVTQKHAFPFTKINTPFIWHEYLSQKFLCAKRKYGLC